MLLTSARNVPDIALASRLSLAGAKLSVPALLMTLTSPFKDCDSVPSGPFTVICAASIVASAPAGSAIGILPTRDILHSLGDVANNFATDTDCARFAVSHDASGGRYDCHAQAIHYIRDIIFVLVDAQPWTGDALQALDNGTAGIIFQADLQF